MKINKFKEEYDLMFIDSPNPNFYTYKVNLLKEGKIIKSCEETYSKVLLEKEISKSSGLYSSEDELKEKLTRLNIKNIFVYLGITDFDPLDTKTDLQDLIKY